MHAFLVAVELVAASVWIGGLLAIALVARIVRAQLEPAARVEFFRTLGRRYLGVGGVSLAAALSCGGALLARGDWSGTKSAAVATAAALVLALAAGVVQARALTRAHRELATVAEELVAARLGRRIQAAATLRGLIAALTLVLVVLAAVLAT